MIALLRKCAKRPGRYGTPKKCDKLAALHWSSNGRVGSFTRMLVVNPNLPIHSVKEMIDYAKANPGYLTFATANTAGIVALETIKHDTGISMLRVPYKSTPPALEDVVTGRVSMTLADFTTAMTQAQFKNTGFEGFSSTPEELGDFIKAQLALWGKMIKDANIELD